MPKELVGEITKKLFREYDGTAAIIEQAVTGFIREILAENLIVPDATPFPQPSTLDNPGPQVHKPFVPPVLHKYTDMQELLLIDPIHEVDETGWPNIAGPVAGPVSESKE